VANASSNNVSVLLGTGSGTFAAKVDYATGTNPYSVSVGDFNGDGKLDLVAANVGSNNVSVLLGTGTGTFAAKVDYATGTNPFSVSVGDFNGDGKLDLVAANYGNNNVSVLLGTGSGTFAASVNYATGTNPYSVSVGDFNGDGKLDLVAANVGSNNVSVLLGTGTGTFAAKVDYATSTTSPFSVSVGDFNGDGKLDLAVANYANSNVSVLLGTGSGTFAAKVDYATGTNPTSVSVGDFNGDGKLDLAVANVNSNTVSMLLNNAVPSATLTITDVNASPVSSTNTGLTVLEDAAITTITNTMLNVTDAEQAASALTYTVTTTTTKGILSNNGTTLGVGSTFTQADIDNNLIKFTPSLNANGSDSFTFSVADGVGGTLSGQSFVFTITPVSDVNITAGITPVEGAVGAFTITLDSAPATDLVVNYILDSASTATLSTDYTVTAGAGISAVTAGTFTILAGQTSATLNVNALTDAVTDPNETVILTLATGAGYQLAATSSSSFAAKVDYVTGQFPYSVSVGDFNGDGKLDLAVANANGSSVSVLLGTGSGTFAAKVDYATGTNPISVSVGDFNGDGKLDLAVANASSNNVSVLLGTGSGTFAAKVDYATGTNPYSVSVGDFNGDGKLDLVAANVGSNNVSVLLGTGTGTFAAKVDYATGTNPFSVSVGDFNGDGKLDLAVANASNNVSVLLGTGSGTFAAKVDYATGTTPYSVSVGDFNGDGKLDLVAANYGNNNVSVLLGTGTGTFAAKVDYATGTNPYSVSVGDFNGDGKLDLVAANVGSNNVSVLLGTGTGTFAAKVDYATGTVPLSVSVGDFNGDGKLDLAVANANSNTVSVLLNDAVLSVTLTITDVNAAPTLGGTFTTTGTVNDNATTTPFSGVTVSDAENNNVSVHITYTAANGTLTGAGLTGSAGNYTLTSASLATVQSELQALVFTPTANQVAPTSTVQTIFTLTPNDGMVNGVANATTNITATSINDAPTATNLNKPEIYTEDTALNLTDIVITDIDSANVTATLTLSSTAAGSLSVATSGAVTSTYSAGVWTASGAIADVNALLAGVTFNPALNFNSSFNIATSISDGMAAVTGTKGFISVMVNDAPVASGNATLAAINEDTFTASGATIGALFSGNFSDVIDTVSGGSTANTFAGIAISNYTSDAAKGVWQYQINGAGAWITLPSTSTLTAVTLASTDLLHFVPAANYNGAATALAANLIESGTTITSGGTIDLTSTGTGGITHYSSATVALNHTITAVNDAPVASGNATLAAINEDTFTASGATIGTLFTGNFSDATDTSGASTADSLIGIAISSYTQDAAKGVWQYQINGAGAWIALNDATVSTAITLTTSDLLRFVPAADYNGAATTLSANLIETGAAAITSAAIIDLSGVGGTGGITPYSLATVTLVHTITAVNDAPVASGNATLAAINEDTFTASGATINSLFTGNFSDATDTSGASTANSLIGIAISSYTQDAAKGVWQYQINGAGAWLTLGDATTSTAITLTTSDLLRFVPAADYNGAATTLSANLIETGAAAITSAGIIDLSGVGVTGGITHYSVATVTLVHTITAVNDVPSFTKGTDQTVNEDAGAQTVTGWATGLSTGPADETSQTLSFNTTNDNNALFSVQPTIDSNGNLNYTPAANANGTATVTVFITDNGGTANGGVNTSTSQTFTITVNAINDAPTGLGNLTLVTVNEGTVSPAGAAINTLTGFGFTDVDTGSSLNGVAVVTNTANAGIQGAWQYSTNGGTNWYNIGTVAGNSALVLSPTALVRFVPVLNFNGTPPSLTVRALDNAYTKGFTSDATLVVLDTTSNGGMTAISGNTNTISTTIAAVNDAPSFSGLGGTVNFTKDSMAVVLNNAVSISDVDLDALNGGAGNYANATLSLMRNGGANADDVFAIAALTQGDNLTVNGLVIGTVTTNSAGTLLLSFNANATKAQVNSVLQQITYRNNANTPPVSVQINWLFNDKNTGAQGKGVELTATGHTTVSITATNDALTIPNSNTTPIINVAHDEPLQPSPPVVVNTPPVSVDNPLTSDSMILWSNPDKIFGHGIDDIKERHYGTSFRDANELARIDLTMYQPIGHYKLQVAELLPHQEVSALQSFSFDISSSAFRHTDSHAQLEFSAKLANGLALPKWLSFNPKMLKFTGTPPEGAGNETVVVTAKDQYGHRVRISFTIRINRDHVTAHNQVAVGKFGFSEQLLAVGKLSKLQESRALLHSLNQL
jgi:hypothetical protein